jgi:transmembrane sensor
VPNGKPRASEGWLSLARRGRYSDAFLASQATFSEACNTGGAADVLLLADSARFTGHLEPARRAYESVRARFPGTEGASLAAFQLGRTDFDQSGDFASAERWLRIYLEEQPSGAFASAAMGRLMEAEVHRGRLDRARVIAERYLTRYPTGAHADTARGVLATAAPSPSSR